MSDAEWEVSYACRRCGYVTRHSALLDTSAKVARSNAALAAEEGLCWQCYIDKDALSQEELEANY